MYEHALTPSNVWVSFRKSGIFPFDPNAIDTECTLPSLVFQGQNLEKDHASISSQGNDGSDLAVKNDGELNEDISVQGLSDRTTELFNKRAGAVLESFLTAKKSRRSISNIIGEKAITENETFEKEKEYTETSKRNKTKSS